jgi:type I restriction-modification system DNA methylase subunit
MPLFQNSVLKKYLKQQDSEAVAKAYKKFTKYFHDPKIQENIRSSKEEEYQGIFLTELFSKILGYTMKPNANFNLVAEYKNEKNSKKADGAILKDDQAIGVIELKGTNTKDLEKVRQQAFDYKANQTGCVYVITSNFEKIRFYINNAVDFEEFDLFLLNQERFVLLYFCLAQENLINNIPLQIKEASVQEEEAITKKFYKDYSTFKRELFRDLVKLNMKNEVFRAELSNEDKDRANKNIKHNLFKKSQKLIDRFLFIFFAEDRGLLPPNSTVKILDQWNKLKEMDEIVPLYSRYKKYFNYLDTGRKGTDKSAEIFAYNGGLFRPDPVLDSLHISDDLLFKHTKDLQAYDFESQVDVNILGHIFENSLNEIESVNAEIEGTDFDKQTTKRKKYGVFYTPKYITKYIVDNTVGKLCTEKKEELGVVEEEYLKSRKGRSKAKLKELLDNLDNYREWLLQITILDPACGSGAFLNQALDFLIKEHEYISELQTNLLGGGFVFPDIENTVLENNIFGVDLNEESVEIAKLSLWLRTAQPRRKLNNLSSNIKCGNSLIDSKAVAGDKAFKWREEFAPIFAKGGFDVVIGNPPYVRQELLGVLDKEYYSKHYSNVYNGVADLYVYFYALSMTILKEKGLLGFITPNKWMERKYGSELRMFLKKYELTKIINYGELKIFEDASTEPAILILSKNISSKKVKYFGVKTLDSAKSLDYSFQEFDKELLDDSIWKFTNKLITSIINKFKDTDVNLSEYTNGGVYYGVKTGMNEAFIISEEKALKIINEDSNSKDIVRKMVEGDDFKKWHLNYSGRYIVGTFPALGLNISDYPSVNRYLSSFLPKLNQTGETFVNAKGVKEKTRKKNNNEWFETQDVIDYHKLIDKPKLIYYHTAAKHNFYLDTEGYCISANCYFISNSDEYLQCVLNSKLFSTVKKYLFPAFGDSENGGRVRLDANKMNTLPIKEVEDNLKGKFKSLAGKMTSNSRSLEDIRIRYVNYLHSQFTIEKLSKKLQNWHELEFGDFIKELNKAIKKAGTSTSSATKLTKIEEMEWMEVFETKKAEALALKAEIDKTDAEIDAMVYELYGLSEEEIKIVEGV